MLLCWISHVYLIRVLTSANDLFVIHNMAVLFCLRIHVLLMFHVAFGGVFLCKGWALALCLQFGALTLNRCTPARTGQSIELILT